MEAPVTEILEIGFSNASMASNVIPGLPDLAHICKSQFNDEPLSCFQKESELNMPFVDATKSFLSRFALGSYPASLGYPGVSSSSSCSCCRAP